MNGSSPSSFHPPDLHCRLTNEQKVNCSSHLFKSGLDLKYSRAVIGEQIRRLRAQLYELKVRNHSDARPFFACVSFCGFVGDKAVSEEGKAVFS